MTRVAADARFDGFWAIDWSGARGRTLSPSQELLLRATLAGGADATTSPNSALAKFFDRHWDPSISWRDLAWLQSITTLPILVKGVVRGDDALLAIEHGAAGVIVSNHGGRQLDTAIATARALPEVVNAIGGRGAVLVDGGIRRGTDVLKALAMGAQAVLLGRPVLWGLAVNGQQGAQQVSDGSSCCPLPPPSLSS